jgi:hypothetical protein
VTLPHTQPQRPVSGFAIATLVLAIMGIVLPAVICGIVALGQITGVSYSERGMVIAGLLISAASVLLVAPCGRKHRITSLMHHDFGVDSRSGHRSLRAPPLLRYRIEAPYAPAGLIAGGAICFAVARWRKQRWLAALGVSLLAQAGLHLHTTVRGRVRVWRRELDRLDLRGNEHLLDVGCGRGAVLVEAAQRLPSGRASAWICGAATTRAATIPASLLPTPAGWGCPERRRAEDSRPARSVRG